MKYVAAKDQKVFAQALKTIYSAPTEAAALQNLKTVDETWGKKYLLAMKSWRENWEELATFFQYPQEIRTMIYTTNAVEALHRQFRKVTKAKSIFPNDEALTKMLFLAYRDIARKWTMQSKTGRLFLVIFLLSLTSKLNLFYDSPTCHLHKSILHPLWEGNYAFFRAKKSGAFSGANCCGFASYQASSYCSLSRLYFTQRAVCLGGILYP